MKTWFEMAVRGELGPEKKLKDQAVLFQRGEPAESCYLLYSGAVEIFQSNDQGQSTVVKLVVAPTILASPEVVAGEKQFLEGIRVAQRAILYELPRERFMEIMRNSRPANLEAFADIVLAFTSAAKYESSRLFEKDVLLAALFCVYGEVFGRPRGDGVVITLKRSQAELAESIGASERQVHRILLKWKEEGILTKEKGQHILLQPAALGGIAGPLKDGLIHRWRAIF